MTTAIRFNPFQLKFHQNPYPTYEYLRREDPIHYSFLKAWVITRYADVEAILKDARFQVDNLPQRLIQKSHYLKQGNLDPLAQTIHKWLFFLEPPNHTRLRGLVSKAFSPVTVEGMRTEIQTMANELLAKVQPTGQMDVIKDLASPLPAMTVTHILGLPPEDYPKLVRWSYELFFVFDQPMSLQGYQKQNQMAIEARDYLIKIITRLEKQPNDGLISRLIAARDEDRSITQDEIIGFCIMLLIVGQETTKSLTGNAMVALLRHPDKLAELKQNPDLIKNAVEELLRYDSPVQVIARLATENVEIGDKTIQIGDKVILCIGAANRDSEQFTNSDQLDFTRRNYSLPFGGGIHFCLGAFLARVQGQIAINAMLQKLPNIQLATDTLDWRETITLRGLRKLPVAFTPSSAI
ncbi:cytochrome P450 [Cronbergia sp. UHCC 0137]|uniref:cytochrome P450 n=1 Tax=Cronbergia sp. UHCC 0137 TaxID=3110239 RepID=UPI002B1FE209|nr:cytochrome P450 [Cronbergia sp. UHCC 0137]MEA5620135.1 cytochrome P450 [Cronbergia sp. UHCC 0137]